MEQQGPLRAIPPSGLSARAIQEWYETVPESATIYRVSAPDQWRGIQVMRASHQLRRFRVTSAGHVVMVYMGGPSRCQVHRGHYTKQHLQTTGSVYLFPVGETVNATCDGQVNDDIYLKLQPDFLADVAAKENLGGAAIDLALRYDIADQQLHKIAALLDSELMAGSPSGRLFGESLGTALAVYLLKKYSSGSSRTTAEQRALERAEQAIPSGSLSQNATIRCAVEYIQENLATDLSLKELASEVGYSPYHLHRLFKSLAGKPLHQYVIEARVERARVLLSTTDLPVAAVATAVGFADHSHLTRHVKRILGVTPGSLRKSQEVTQKAQYPPQRSSGK